MSTTHARWYRTGTISLTNGSATVTGALTAFVNNAYRGDTLYILSGADAGSVYELDADASANTSLTLQSAFTGTTASGIEFAISPTSVQRTLATEIHARLSALLGDIKEIYVSDGVPSDTLGADG